MRNIIVILSVLMFLTTFSYAQQAEEENNSANFASSGNSQKDLMREFKSAQHNKIMIDSMREILESSQSKLLLNAECEYNISSYKHRRAVFDWQLSSSKILFWTIIIIVFIGLFFSGLQFYVSFKRQNEKQNGSLKNKYDAVEDKTTFEATLKGVKLSSSVLGVIILIISLCFFYLYLVYIYPINEIVIQTPTKTSIEN